MVIGHTSVNVHRIPTKRSTDICSNELFKCCIGVIWQILRSVQKEEKTKKLKQNFGHSYLGNSWSGFLQIWYVGFPTWPARL